MRCLFRAGLLGTALVAAAIAPPAGAEPSSRKGKGGAPDPAPAREIPFGEPYALGGLGAQGFMRRDHILVSGIDADSPAAQAGLAKGEKLVGVKRAGADAILFRDSSDSPLSQLVTELSRAQAKGAAIELLAEREGKLVRLKHKPERVKGHAPKCPRKCARCQGYVDAALSSLAKGGGGRFSGEASTVEASVRGLAFLASGSTLSEGSCAKPLQECVTAALQGVSRAMGEGGRPGAGGPMCNWPLGFGGLFLAEVYARFGEEGLRYPGALYPAAGGSWGAPPSEGAPFADLLARVARQIASQQESSGGWAHGGEVGKPNQLGYIEVQACANWCLAALGRMRQAGVAVPQDAIEKGIAYAKQCSAGGGISYSAKNKGIPQIGRTGATLFAFWCCDATDDRLFADMQRYVLTHLDRMPEGHASPTMHFLSCGLGFRALGVSSDAWGKFWEEYLPKMESLRRPDGTFALWPSDVGNDPKWKGMIPEKQLPDAWPTSVHALLLQLPSDRVFKGLKRRKKER